MSNIVTGKITDYGHAPYKNDPTNQQSFFVEVENKNGSKSQFWGLGLQDALNKNSEIQKGDTVTLVDKGQNEGSRKREWDIEKYEPLIEHKNSIENAEKTLEKNVNVAGEKTKEEPLEFKKSGLKDELELPQSIKNNYVALVKNRLFGDEKINFYDKADSTSIAFEDRKSTLNTSRNDEKTVNAMLDVAESKGWSSVSLKGTEEFKQKAWLEASLRGIDTKGYQPTEKDLAELKIKQEERSYNAIKVEETREKIVVAPIPVEQAKDAVTEKQALDAMNNLHRVHEATTGHDDFAIKREDYALTSYPDDVKNELNAAKELLNKDWNVDAKALYKDQLQGIVDNVEKGISYHQDYHADKERENIQPEKQNDKDIEQAQDKNSIDPIELQNEKTVAVIETFRDELPQQEQGVNRQSGSHRLMIVLDNYKDKIEKKDLIAVEAYKSVIQEKYKDHPEKMDKRLDDLTAKIPDIASGKYNLPEPPTIKHQAEIEVSNNKQGDKQRAR